MSDQERSRTDHFAPRSPSYWGWIERFMLVFALLILAVMSLMLFSEMAAELLNLEPSGLDAIRMGFNILGLILLFLLWNSLGGFILWIIEAAGKRRAVDAANSLVGFGGATFLLWSVLDKTPQYTTGPEFYQIELLLTGSLVFLLVVRGVPRFVWERVEGRLAESRLGEVFSA